MPGLVERRIDGDRRLGPHNRAVLLGATRTEHPHELLAELRERDPARAAELEQDDQPPRPRNRGDFDRVWALLHLTLAEARDEGAACAVVLEGQLWPAMVAQALGDEEHYANAARTRQGQRKVQAARRARAQRAAADRLARQLFTDRGSARLIALARSLSAEGNIPLSAEGNMLDAFRALDKGEPLAAVDATDRLVAVDEVAGRARELAGKARKLGARIADFTPQQFRLIAFDDARPGALNSEAAAALGVSEVRVRGLRHEIKHRRASAQG